MTVKYRLLSVVVSLSVLCSCGCSEKGATHKEPIQGVWKCTPETAAYYPNGIRETVLLIEGNPQEELTARGCFTFEGNYHHDWGLEEINYDGSTRLFTILDGDGDRYVAHFDPSGQTLSGYIYSGEPTDSIPLDTLDFIRGENSLAEKLFFPRRPSADGSLSFFYEMPAPLNDGLNTASLFEFIRDTAVYDNLMTRIINQEFGRLESLLVMKEGQLILEEYFYGYNRTRLHNIHSCTKSITSLLLGIVMDRNGETDLGIPLLQFFPEYDSLLTGSKRMITLEHLLTMHVGFASDDKLIEPGFSDQLQNILSLPLISEPGEVFQYDDNNSILLGGILFRLAGMHADQIAREFLFEPLGISEVRWEFLNGLPQCHSNLMMLPRDMVKIGQLVLNDGNWKQQQVVPAAWVTESTRPQVEESVFFDYGYHWWHQSDNNHPCWENPKMKVQDHPDIALALGFAGQFIMVIRDLNMVVVTTASDYGDFSIALKKIQLVVEELFPMFSI